MATSCEFEFMEYLDEDSIDPNLICSICHKPFKDPVCTSCDHTYGRECITRWLTTNVVYSCPTCMKQPLLLSELTSASRPLRNMLDQLRVRCTLCERTDIQRGNFADHIKKGCPKAVVQCQAADIKCPWEGQRDELVEHMSACVFEPLRPVLASLMAENRELMKLVREHDNEIKKLTGKTSQIIDVATNHSDDENDVSSVSEFPVGDTTQKEEDAIFIRNLPDNIKFDDLFSLFSKMGRVKYDPMTQKTSIFIFRKPNHKNEPCTAKVIYVDKESAAAAVAEYNNKHIPQWNTRLRVSISDTSRHIPKGSGKISKGNTTTYQEGKPTGDIEKSSNKGANASNIVDSSEPLAEQNRATIHKNTRLRSQPHHRQNKPAS